MVVLKGRQLKGSQRDSRRPKFSTVFNGIAALCFLVGIINSYKPLPFIQPLIPLVSGFLALVIPTAAQWYFSSRPESSKTATTETPVLPPIVVPAPYTVPPSVSQPHRPRNILGQPKAIESKAIQKRKQLVENIYDRLVRSDDLTAIMLTGLPDSGKTILASLVYHYAEVLHHEGFGPFTAEPLWLQIDASVTMAELTETIFLAQGIPSLTDFSDLSPQIQAEKLFDALDIPMKSRLVILDDFDALFDEQTGYIRTDSNYEAVSSWIDIINGHTQPCVSRFLFISRFQIRGTKKDSPYFPEHLMIKPIEGLRLVEGVELLRKRKVKGEDADLCIAVEYCAGHPGALIQLASDLYSRKQSLSNLLVDPTYAQFWRATILRSQDNPILVQLNQLQLLQRKLLLAFSIYREPVALNIAMESLVFFDVEATDAEIMNALDVLLVQSLLQPISDEHDPEKYYQPHVIVANYVRDNLVVIESDQQINLKDCQAAHTKAALLYLQQAAKNCDPRELRQRNSSVHEFIEAIWHYCRAWHWQEAYNVMKQEDLFSYLNRWGSNLILLELFQQLLPLAESTAKRLERQAAVIYNNLGRVCADLGKKERAKEYYQKALNIYEKKKDSKGVGRALNNLGAIWDDLGDKRKALENLNRALGVLKGVGDLEGVGRTLNNLGAVYDSIGEQEQAQVYYEQALEAYKQVGDLGGEGRTLNNLSVMYANKKAMQQALEHCNRALQKYRELEDWWRESKMLNNLAMFYNILGKQQEVQNSLEEALKIYKKLGDLVKESKMLNNLGVFYDSIGETERALEYYQQAMRLCRRIGDRKGEGGILNNLGGICAKRGEIQQALGYYEQALQAFEELDDLDGRATTLHNLGLLYFIQCNYKLALAFFGLAQQAINAKSSIDEIQE